MTLHATSHESSRRRFRNWTMSNQSVIRLHAVTGSRIKKDCNVWDIENVICSLTTRKGRHFPSPDQTKEEVFVNSSKDCTCNKPAKEGSLYDEIVTMHIFCVVCFTVILVVYQHLPRQRRVFRRVILIVAQHDWYGSKQPLRTTFAT